MTNSQLERPFFPGLRDISWLRRLPALDFSSLVKKRSLTPFIYYSQTQDTCLVQYKILTMERKLLTHFLTFGKRFERSDLGKGTQWHTIVQRLACPVQGKKSTDCRCSFQFDYHFFIVKRYFTTGLRKVDPGTAHVYDVGPKAIYAYVVSERAAATYGIRSQTGVLHPVDRGYYKKRVLQADGRYLIPENLWYIVCTFTNAYFSIYVLNEEDTRQLEVTRVTLTRDPAERILGSPDSSLPPPTPEEPRSQQIRFLVPASPVGVLGGLFLPASLASSDPPTPRSSKRAQRKRTQPIPREERVQSEPIPREAQPEPMQPIPREAQPEPMQPIPGEAQPEPMQPIPREAQPEPMQPGERAQPRDPSAPRLSTFTTTSPKGIRGVRMILLEKDVEVATPDKRRWYETLFAPQERGAPLQSRTVNSTVPDLVLDLCLPSRARAASLLSHPVDVNPVEVNPVNPVTHTFVYCDNNPVDAVPPPTERPQYVETAEYEMVTPEPIEEPSPERPESVPLDLFSNFLPSVRFSPISGKPHSTGQTESEPNSSIFSPSTAALLDAVNSTNLM